MEPPYRLVEALRARDIFVREGEYFLDAATQIATQAHAGVKDKCGLPYILHPMRVMGFVFKAAGEGPYQDPKFRLKETLAAAALHDVLEDTLVKAADLRAAGIPDSVLEIVDAVTRRKGMLAVGGKDETYAAFIERSCAGPNEALALKLADLTDNLDPCRTSPDRAGLLPRYRKAVLALIDELTRRNLMIAQPYAGLLGRASTNAQR